MNNKDKYGEVFTPESLVEQMITDSSPYLQLNGINVFEPGAGKGVFFDVIQNQKRLLGNKFKYTFNEINNENTIDLYNISNDFSNNVDFIMKDLLLSDSRDFILNSADLVIGNLPFNSGAKKFVPSLAINHKNEEGVTRSKSMTLWSKMVRFCFESVLKPGGHFLAIIPCIWLKVDRSGIHSLFTEQNKIILLKVFDCQSANKIFNYNCQTPICYVLIKKETPNASNTFKLFEGGIKNGYVDFTLQPGFCIPTNNASHFTNHLNYLSHSKCKSCFSYLRKISTLKPACIEGEIYRYRKGGLENHPSGEENNYKIITGSMYDKKKNILSLNGFVSTEPALYHGIPKLILPHKRRAKFFKDYSGEYSCFGRDMYIFECESSQEIDLLYEFFNSPIISTMIENGFTIRMNFIEKYVFQYIPWIFDINFNRVDYENSCTHETLPEI